MTTTLTDNRTVLLGRVVRAIRRTGPLTWEAARLAMFNGRYDRRDAGFHSETLLEWVAAGKLAHVELPNGDSLIGL